MHLIRRSVVLGSVLAVCCAGCSSNTTVLPATPTSPVSETFTSQIFAQGTAFRTFTAAQDGTVTVTLLGGPAGTPLGLGVGLPGETAGHCQLTVAINASPGGPTVLSGPIDAGMFCAGVFDIGDIPPATAAPFSIRIDHP